MRKHWENTGKREKTCKNKGIHWMTKFYFGKTQENIEKTQENIGKTQENNQKHWEILDDKVLFWENTEKHRENMGKHAKTWESIG